MQQEQEFDGVVMTRLKSYSLAELEHLFLEFFVELTAVRPSLPRKSAAACCILTNAHLLTNKDVAMWPGARFHRVRGAESTEAQNI